MQFEDLDTIILLYQNLSEIKWKTLGSVYWGIHNVQPIEVLFVYINHKNSYAFLNNYYRRFKPKKN